MKWLTKEFCRLVFEAPGAVAGGLNHKQEQRIQCRISKE
jgi:hypothetical protein